MAKISRSKPTIYDLARAAGVSIGTVSRVLNRRKDVAPATRNRVLRAMRDARFTPRLTAPRVSIGLVMQETRKIHEVGYIGAVLSSLVNHAQRRGAVVEIVSAADIGTIYSRYIQGLVGLLFGRGAELLRDVRDVPIVLINNAPDYPHMHCVVSDHAQGARLGTEHLLKRGHRRVALVQIENDDWGARERERGYREAHAKAGVIVRPELIVYLEHRSIEEGFDPVLRHKPTAVLVGGEDLSIAITDEIVHRLGMRIPQDISLVTSEVRLVSQLFSPPHTTVAQSWDDLAERAIARVFSLIEGGRATPQRVTLPSTLIERASVRSRA